MPAADLSYKETDDPGYADRRNFYKVEKWSRDGQWVEEVLFAGIAPSNYWLSYHLPTLLYSATTSP